MTTIDIATLFMTPEGAEDMAVRATEVRDSYDGFSATHWSAWDAIVTAARNAATMKRAAAREPKYKLIASCEGEADGAVLDMLIAHGCPAREDVLAMLREGERTDIDGLLVERVNGGWHLLRELTEET